MKEVKCTFWYEVSSGFTFECFGIEERFSNFSIIDRTWVGWIFLVYISMVFLPSWNPRGINGEMSLLFFFLTDFDVTLFHSWPYNIRLAFKFIDLSLKPGVSLRLENRKEISALLIKRKHMFYCVVLSKLHGEVAPISISEHAPEVFTQHVEVMRFAQLEIIICKLIFINLPVTHNFLGKWFVFNHTRLFFFAICEFLPLVHPFYAHQIVKDAVVLHNYTFVIF